MWGLEVDIDAAAIVDAARERGLLVNRTSTSVLRLLPPYIVSAGEVSEGVAILEAAVQQAGGAS
jgi:acetylornithine/succinyldiaminopimelate/putrescine aminotransferase